MLRRLVLQRRDLLSVDERFEKGGRIAERVIGLPEARAARVIMCFVSFGSEVPTEPIIAWCLSEGKKLAVPRVVTAQEMEAFVVSRPQHELQAGRHGMLEPRDGLEQVQPGDIDLIVVPGVCFDKFFNNPHDPLTWKPA